MGLVISDTGPINYLILIESTAILPALFQNIVLPDEVRAELASAGAASLVRAWIANPPPWIEVRPPVLPADDRRRIHRGEQGVLALAASCPPGLILMDDRKAVIAARRQGLRVTGTLGVLDIAASRGLIDFSAAIHRLNQTTFRRPQSLLDDLLKKHGSQGH